MDPCVLSSRRGPKETTICTKTKRSGIYSIERQSNRTIRIPATVQSPIWNQHNPAYRERTFGRACTCPICGPKNTVIPSFRYSVHLIFRNRRGLLSHITVLPICPDSYPKE